MRHIDQLINLSACREAMRYAETHPDAQAAWADLRACDVQRGLESIGFRFASDRRGNLIVVPMEPRVA
jgi:hypothetical protein